MAELEEIAGENSIEDMLSRAREESAKEADEKPSARKRSTTRTPRSKPSLKGPLTEFYTTLGAGVFILNQADGVAVISHAESMAESLDNWGKVNSNVYKALDKLCTTGALGGVIAAHAPVILAILGNHDINLATLFTGKNADENKENSEESFSGRGAAPPPPDYPNTNGVVAPIGGVTPLIVEAR